ncbi:MAG: septum formation inhibitor Maf [Lachnospiraceae bacterium]|nr:septum formation inhibitor Maf [Lachnospiraceae bacterium]
MDQRLILASASPRRTELLTQAGYSFEVIPSQVEEIITKTRPSDVVMELAAQKAQDVARNHEDAIVIGADTIVAYEDQILGKPASALDAVNMLKMLQGKVHQVYTGVSILCPAKNIRHTFAEKTEVEFYPMTEEEIQAYVHTGDCMDKAGAYGIQTAFCVYVRQIRGDYNNVVGLPVARLYQELKKITGQR